MEVIGIVDSNQSIRAESCADFGENFVDLDEDAAKKVQDITVFFSKYYKMFNHETDLVYTLYAEGCILNWPNSEGAVITINTIEAAKNLFLMKSRLWKDVLMRTICVQAIHNGGFLAVVIGRFTTLDKQICKFSQTFILSEKDNEYKIVNDVLIIQGFHEKVCIIYDKNMMQHCEIADEVPARISVIMDKFEDEGLLRRCVVEAPAAAKDSEILAVHQQIHLEFIKNLPLSTRTKQNAYRNCFETQNISWSKGTLSSVLLSAGGVLKAFRLVMSSRFDHAFAVVRPPGHHAKADKADGFCFLSNIAIGARDLLNNHGAEKVLVVDFDVHHGNGTQEIFFNDDRVLFFSSHRGNIAFPAAYTMQAKNVGIGRGAGYNVNSCLPNEFEDDDLLAGIQYVLLPVAKAFLPDIVLVSAGFDAAMGDPLGGCKVTPPGFATVIDELKRIPAKRGLVLALEGGYNLESLANSAAACLKALLGDREDVLTLEGLCPYKETWDEIVASRQQLTPVWPVLESAIPQAVLDNYKLAGSQLPAAGQEPQEPAFPRRNPRRTVTERNQRRASAGKDPGKH